jgi:APA family basic amino acid/polyamine antiporter
MASLRAAVGSQPPPKGRLLRVLGVAFGLAVTVGATIGGGILRNPATVAAQLPHTGLFLGVWVAGGLYALLCAPSFAELGTMVPRSGGLYVFARRALGDYAGFVVGWSDWLAWSGGTAALAILLGEFLAGLFPPLAGHEVGVASAILLLFALLQWRGVRWGSMIQQGTSLLKALVLVGLGLAAFLLGGRGQGAGSGVPLPAAPPLAVGLVLALQAVIWTYDSYYAVVYYSEEVRNPGREIPRSIFGGLALIIGLYLLLNLAFLYVLPLPEMAASKFVGGAVAEALFGGRGDAVIRVVMIVSLLGTVNAGFLSAPRVLLAMSRDGLFWERAGRVNEGGTPTATLLATTAVSLLFLLTGTFEKALAVTTFFVVLNYAMSFLSVFVLRRREPDTERPYRAWGYPWTTGVALIGAIAFLAGAVMGDTENSVYALVALAASYPGFLLTRWLARRRKGDARRTELIRSPNGPGRPADGLAIEAVDPGAGDAQVLVARLLDELVRRYGGDLADDFAVADALGPRGGFLLGRWQGRPVACGALRPLGPTLAELKRVYVEPEFRGRGIARSLLAALEAHAREAGYSHVRLETGVRQPEAIRLYEVAGYRRIENYGTYRDDPRSICFEKALG